MPYIITDTGDFICFLMSISKLQLNVVYQVHIWYKLQAPKGRKYIPVKIIVLSTSEGFFFKLNNCCSSLSLSATSGFKCTALTNSGIASSLLFKIILGIILKSACDKVCTRFSLATLPFSMLSKTLFSSLFGKFM